MLIPLRIMAEQVAAEQSKRIPQTDFSAMRIFASDGQIKAWGAEAVKAKMVVSPTKPGTVTAIYGVTIITVAVATPYIGWPVYP